MTSSDTQPMPELSEAREIVAEAKRVVVKIGSSSLTSVEGGLNRENLERVTNVLARHRAAGHEVILVSSGAVAAGLEPMGLTERPDDLATKQAAAAVGQSLVMAAYTDVLAEHGVVPAQVLLTAEDLMRRTSYRNAQRTIERLLALGCFPIVNENDAVATSEVRFGDNDRIAALVAHLAHADALILLSDVAALYTAPPGTPGAEAVDFVADQGDLEDLGIGGTGAAGVGSGGMQTKVQAATMAADSGIPTVLTSAPNVEAALHGDEIGTYFGVTHKRRQKRILWLGHLARTVGKVRVDAGAVKALEGRGTSLLAVGVTDVEGEFEAGDPVDVVGPRGDLVGRGFVNFSSEELPMMFGLTTEELGERYGQDYRKEVIHRNDLMLSDAVF
ncbi:glutamate 5-kinase [Brevibacterium samyangense]|uniref:Glutamate 5-kinase n=2 Tax=Brevibacterium samyangense TaxID=366888 RepID=A0ABN2TA14_9MICO